MTEYVLLYLSGERRRRFLRVSKINGVSLIMQMLTAALCMLLSVLLPDSVPFVAILTPLIAVTAAFGIFSIVFALHKNGSTLALLIEESEANLRLSEKEKSYSERYFEKLKEILSERKYFGEIVSVVVNAVVNLSSAIIALLTSIGVFAASAQAACGFVFLACVILSGGMAVVSLIIDIKRRSRFVNCAEEEIYFLKSERGDLTSVSHHPMQGPQDYFLTDNAELRIFNRYTYRSAVYTLIWIVCAVVLGVVSGNVASKGAWAFWLIGAIGAAATVAWIVSLILTELKKNAIYVSNAKKLTENETENEVRMQLQKAYQKVQRIGNIIFSTAIFLAMVLGLSLGFAQTLRDPQTSLAANIGGTSVFFLLIFAVLSFVVYIPIYIKYRNRAKPLEEKVKEVQNKNAE
jgi:hypothetical protein